MGESSVTTEPTERQATARVLALIGAAGPVFYIVFVTVLGLLREGYNPIRDTQSELGAVDSPFRALMNVAGFMGLGIIAGVASRPPSRPNWLFLNALGTTLI